MLDIDETLIASADRNEKDIMKEHMTHFVDEHAKALGNQYQNTMANRHLNVNFGLNQSCPPLHSPSIEAGIRKLSLKSTHSAVSALSDITNITNLSNETVDTMDTVDSSHSVHSVVTEDSVSTTNDENNFLNVHPPLELKFDQLDDPDTTDDLFTLGISSMYHVLVHFVVFSIRYILQYIPITIPFTSFQYIYHFMIGGLNGLSVNVS